MLLLASDVIGFLLYVTSFLSRPGPIEPTASPPSLLDSSKGANGNR